MKTRRKIYSFVFLKSKAQSIRPYPNFERYYTDLQKRKTRLYALEYPEPVQSNSRLRFHDLPPDVQARLLANLNEELINFELQNMLTDVGTQAVTDYVSLFNYILFIIEHCFI